MPVGEAAHPTLPTEENPSRTRGLVAHPGWLGELVEFDPNLLAGRHTDTMTSGIAWTFGRLPTRTTSGPRPFITTRASRSPDVA